MNDHTNGNCSLYKILGVLTWCMDMTRIRHDIIYGNDLEQTIYTSGYLGTFARNKVVDSIYGNGCCGIAAIILNYNYIKLHYCLYFVILSYNCLYFAVDTNIIELQEFWDHFNEFFSIVDRL